MEEETKSIEEKPKVEPTKKTRGKKILLSLLILVLIAAAAGGAYWWRDKTAKELEQQQADKISSLQKSETSLKKQLADEKAKAKKAAAAADQTACTTQPASANTISNVKDSITSGNTAALEGYMATSVNVITAGSGAASAKTPTQAVTSITSFISPDTTSWDYNFSLSASTLSSYGKGSYSKYFPSTAVVGKATNKKVISFSFDCNGKINTVLLASNEALLL